jgi:membrane protease YdiL (CAAX protease family)
MKDKSLVKYLIWAFALAWPIQAVASYYALQGNAQLFQLLLMLCMLIPAAATLLARISLPDMGWKLDLRWNWRWFLAAWLVPAALTILGAALYFLAFPARLDLSGGYVRDQILAAGGEETLSQLEVQGFSLLLPIALLTGVQVLFYAFVNAIPALGEEIGWRGAMLPRLKERFGPARGWLLGGLIWGVWHWPVVILAGYEYGLAYWGAPVLGPIAFCLFTTAAGILLDALYEKTGSIWAPALGHGAVNAAASFPLLFLKPDYTDQMILGPCMVGLIAGIPLFLLAAWVLLRAKKPEKREAI